MTFNLPPLQLHSRPVMPSLRDRLQEQFGLDDLYPWQQEAIAELLDGSRRVLLVAPTGGGKSLCYQLPAVVLGGTTVVISPLIALMEDQVRSLLERSVPATFLASTLGFEECRRREAALCEGRFRLVYVAPERLRSPRALGVLARLRPPLLAVDEAHCISEWGHDFRPDYLRLGQVLQELQPARVLACTATATPAVRAEIRERLGLPPDRTTVILRGFARPNLHLEVREIDRPAARREAALSEVRQALGFVREPQGTAIVYAGTRRSTDQLAELLSLQGWRTGAYHAGLGAEVRERVSADFAAGGLDVVVATNAFGMGIDRPDIRAVIHTAAPGSIEQYYQEVGRAGRDGAAARGVLLSGTSDFGLRRTLIERSGPAPDDDAPLTADEAARAAENKQRHWRLFLDLMRYVEAGSCRHDFILRYFGDEGETLGGCGHCDICELLGRDSQLGGGGVTAADVLLVRKALAGVARLRRRAGLQALIASLHGESSERLRQLGLTALSTHGLLKEHSKSRITKLLRRLITAGLVDITAGDYPKPYLTPEGWATMKERLPVRVIVPPPAPDKSARRAAGARCQRPAGVAEPAADAALFERLRQARLELARAQRVPAYVVCHDSVLMEIAARRPVSPAELAEVPGMGPKRMEACGKLFLTIVRAAGEAG